MEGGDDVGPSQSSIRVDRPKLAEQSPQRYGGKVMSMFRACIAIRKLYFANYIQTYYERLSDGLVKFMHPPYVSRSGRLGYVLSLMPAKCPLRDIAPSATAVLG